MGIFSRLRPQSAPPPLPRPLQVDPLHGDPDAAALVAALKSTDWPAARAILAAGHHPDDLDFLLDTAAGVDGLEQWLPDRLTDDPDDTLASLVYGIRLTAWAWQARTGKLAKYVSADRFEIFFERLQQAEEVLLEVVRREPANAAGWTGLITTAMGLSLPMEETRRRFDRAVAIDPGHFGAHTAALQAYCDKWGGSHETMYAFARTAVASAPAGSRLGALIPLAHIEEWMRNSGNPPHFQPPAVSHELVTAAERSVLHPDYQRRKTWAIEQNAFAMVFCLAEDWTRAKDQFAVIGGHVTAVPWQYAAESPEEGFLRHYFRVYNPAARRQRVI